MEARLQYHYYITSHIILLTNLEEFYKITFLLQVPCSIDDQYKKENRKVPNYTVFGTKPLIGGWLQLVRNRKIPINSGIQHIFFLIVAVATIRDFTVIKATSCIKHMDITYFNQ